MRGASVFIGLLALFGAQVLVRAQSSVPFELPPSSDDAPEPPHKLTLDEARGIINFETDSRAVIAEKLRLNDHITIADVDRVATERARQKALDEKRPWYDLKRVEVTGIWSNDRETEARFPGMFDESVRPSYLNESWVQKPGVIDKLRQKWWEAKNYDADLLGLQLDRDGNLSARAKDVLAKLRGKEIDELVCHSWGSEIIYNAILQGYIKAPTHLVALGAPDTNLEKWKALARWTGTDVVYLKASGGVTGDKIAVAGALREAAVPGDKAMLEYLWYKHCTDEKSGSYRNTCHSTYSKYKDATDPAPFNDLSGRMRTGGGLTGHDRLAYYEQLRAIYPEYIVPAKDVAGQAQQISRAKIELDQEYFAKADDLIRESRARIDQYSQELKERMREEAAERERNGYSGSVSYPSASPLDGPRAAEIADPKAPSDAWGLAARLCRGGAVSQDDLELLLLRLGTYMRHGPVAAAPSNTCENSLYNEICGAASGGRSLNAARLGAEAQDWARRNAPAPAPPQQRSSGGSSSIDYGSGRRERRDPSPPPSQNLDLEHAKETVDKEKQKSEECHWTDPKVDCWHHSK